MLGKKTSSIQHEIATFGMRSAENAQSASDTVALYFATKALPGNAM